MFGEFKDMFKALLIVSAFFAGMFAMIGAALLLYAPATYYMNKWYALWSI